MLQLPDRTERHLRTDGSRVVALRVWPKPQNLDGRSMEYPGLGVVVARGTVLRPLQFFGCVHSYGVQQTQNRSFGTDVARNGVDGTDLLRCVRSRIRDQSLSELRKRYGIRIFQDRYHWICCDGSCLCVVCFEWMLCVGILSSDQVVDTGFCGVSTTWNAMNCWGRVLLTVLCILWDFSLQHKRNKKSQQIRLDYNQNIEIQIRSSSLWSVSHHDIRSIIIGLQTRFKWLCL